MPGLPARPPTCRPLCPLVPACSGKSTVGKLVSQALGYCFFDTGAAAGPEKGFHFAAELRDVRRCCRMMRSASALAPSAAPPCPALSADGLIEQLSQKRVAEIFAEDGEEEFRQLETQVLAVSRAGRWRSAMEAQGRPRDLAAQHLCTPMSRCRRLASHVIAASPVPHHLRSCPPLRTAWWPQAAASPRAPRTGATCRVASPCGCLARPRCWRTASWATAPSSARCCRRCLVGCVGRPPGVCCSGVARPGRCSMLALRRRPTRLHPCCHTGRGGGRRRVHGGGGAPGRVAGGAQPAVRWRRHCCQPERQWARRRPRRARHGSLLPRAGRHQPAHKGRHGYGRGASSAGHEAAGKQRRAGRRAAWRSAVEPPLAQSSLRHRPAPRPCPRMQRSASGAWISRLCARTCRPPCGWWTAPRRRRRRRRRPTTPSCPDLRCNPILSASLVFPPPVSQFNFKLLEQWLRLAQLRPAELALLRQRRRPTNAVMLEPAPFAHA